ncbi:MAG: hypothetical protein ABI026_01565 [Gemmatimonadaceae bacterium]
MPSVQRFAWRSPGAAFPYRGARIGEQVARFIAIGLMISVPVIITSGYRRLATHRSGGNSNVAATMGSVFQTKPGGRRTERAAVETHGATLRQSAIDYMGHDARGIPHYARRAFSAEERRLLRSAYGVEDPNRMYVSDSTPEGVLKYDTHVKRCARCYVNSYRVGFVSIRRRGESWDQLERRVHHMTRKGFPAFVSSTTTSLSALDPDITGDVRRMLADAHHAGFRLRITETYRSPEREAYLMMLGGSRTHTLTSLHSYGRALDIAVDHGNQVHARAERVAFRRWLIRYHGGEFRIVGTPSSTWDWRHVTVPNAAIGFHSIAGALARARICLGAARPDSANVLIESCDFKPHLAIRSAQGPLLTQVRSLVRSPHTRRLR